MQIPDRFSDVTAEWLTSALATRYPNVVVTRCDIQPVKQTKQNKVRVAVDYNATGKETGLPSSLFVKGSFHGQNPFNDRAKPDVPLSWGNRAETLSYAEVLPLTDAEHAKCLGARWDEETWSSYIVMEDLSVRGVRYFDAFSTLTYGEAAGFLDEMARLHARFWDSAEFQDRGGRFAGLLERSETLKTMFEEGFVKLGAANAEEQQRLGGGSLVAHDHLLPNIYRNKQKQREALIKFFAINDSFSKSIVMGDEHLRNMYISGAGRPGFVDWACRIEGWPQTFGTFLVNSLDPLDRRKWEKPLLSHYLNRLSFYGVKAPLFEEAWFGYRCGAVFPLLVWPNNRGSWQPEATNAGCTVRSVIAALDLDTYSAIGV